MSHSWQTPDQQFAQSVNEGGMRPTTENPAVRFLRIQAAKKNVENAAELFLIFVAGRCGGLNRGQPRRYKDDTEESRSALACTRGSPPGRSRLAGSRASSISSRRYSSVP